MKYLKLWQAKHGLNDDGKIGYNTLTKFREVYGLTKEQTANIMGQVFQETGGFKKAVEDLSYRAQRIAEVWETRYTKKVKTTDPNTGKTITTTVVDPIVNRLAKNPVALGNNAYANRNGNGNEASGDGYKYRGRAAIMITGKTNYILFAKYLGIPAEKMIENPDIALDYYFESAIFYFKTNNLLEKSKTVSDKVITEITKSVNGGYHGLAERKAYTKKFLAMQK